MIKNKTISFILAFIISGIISGSIYVFVFIKNLDLFGLAEIQDPEGRGR